MLLPAGGSRRMSGIGRRSMQETIVHKCREMILQHQMILPGDTGVVAVSGGADSVFLLHLLHMLSEEMHFRIVVAHVHHGIRGKEADRDAEYVRRLSGELGVPCRVFERDVPKMARENGMTLEEAGRMARYACLEELKRETGARWIALAHHKDDQIETVLFHLLRGSGFRGLRGMMPVQGDRIRPLLSVDRQEIEDWLLQRGISYCTDTTNSDPEYARNRIRTIILPEMKKVSPGAGEHLLRLAGDAEELYKKVRETAELFRQECREIFSADGKLSGILIPEKTGRSVPDPGSPGGELVRMVLEELTGSTRDISRRHVESVISLFSKETGKKIMLPGRVVAERTYAGVLIRHGASAEKRYTEEKLPGKLSVVRREYISGEEIPTGEYRKMMDASRVAGEPVLRFPHSGDRIMVRADGSTKKLQRFFTDNRIPVEDRASWPVVADEQGILWVIGLRLSERVKVREETKEIYLLEYTEIEEG